jgi:hypothetical protein
MDNTTVFEYFDKYVLVWMCSDIENCIKAKANVAVAALLMTYTENVGALIGGNLGRLGTSESDFNRFLEQLQFKGNSDYYKGFEIRYTDPGSPDVQSVNIYKAFRCGFIHEYGAKVPCVVENHPDNINHFSDDDPGIGWCAQVSVVYDGSNRSDYVPPQYSIKKKFLRFHTNAYFRDFKRALHNIRNNMGTDQDLMKRMKISLGRVFNRTLIIP